MTVIRVNPESVRGYGESAQGIFESMRTSLNTLVTDVVGVRYFGPNAVQFKTECGRVASDFANKLNADMGAMADAIRTSTTNIAASLGGAPVTIAVNGSAITPPVPQSVDYVDVDTTALKESIGPVNRHFTSLREQLDSNLSKLRATDWEGNAKVSAVEAVSTFTNSAKTKCTEAEKSITDYINAQVDSVTSADV